MEQSRIWERSMEMWAARKAELRKIMRGRLKALSKEAREKLDQRLCERVLVLPETADAEWIYGYMALSWEPGTKKLLERLLETGKRVALPRVSGADMDFYEIRTLSDLKEGAWHILEPGEHCQKAACGDAFMLVPGMAFTEGGDRLGKGGGYYDRFLMKEPEHRTAALSYEFQLVDELPSEKHDRKVDIIVTPEYIFRRNWLAGKGGKENGA